MTTEELSKRVHEITGWCWHECICEEKKKYHGVPPDELDWHCHGGLCRINENFDPTSPADFFKLLTWCRLPENEKEREGFLKYMGAAEWCLPIEYIDPLPFATAFEAGWGK